MTKDIEAPPPGPAKPVVPSHWARFHQELASSWAVAASACSRARSTCSLE
ncbi:hypothetical protein FNQ90_01140 [Streptomyces alkaliphilus]|uniref:Uncharacterized protein n=1 Tax=Streptomyces alkaliphilus TaxID=1472722 RepID=A0A7W3T9K0_9ACTN|nr:hypothetical protein [Streptomyces alkaliphilus]